MEKKKLTDIYLDDKITKEAYDDKYSEISNGKIKLYPAEIQGIFVDEEEKDEGFRMQIC